MMVGQNEGQECQTDKMELDIAELQVHSAAQARQGEYECRCSVQSLSSKDVYNFVELETLINFVSCLC